MSLSRKNLDELSTESRDFYERAYMKVNLSLIFGALGMMFLGLTSASGGLSQANSYFHDIADGFSNDEQTTSFQALTSGYGFGCFVFLIAAILAFSVAIYISPFVGSKNEGNILRTPQDIAQTHGANENVPVAQPVRESADRQYEKQHSDRANPILQQQHQQAQQDVKPGFEQI
jgi:hypothetical protein